MPILRGWQRDLDQAAHDAAIARVAEATRRAGFTPCDVCGEKSVVNVHSHEARFSSFRCRACLIGTVEHFAIDAGVRVDVSPLEAHGAGDLAS